MQQSAQQKPPVFSLLALIEAEDLYVFVNNLEASNGSTVSFQPFYEGSISIQCYYGITLRKTPPTLYDVSYGENPLDVEFLSNSRDYYIEYRILQSEKEGQHKYRCMTASTHVEVVLSYSSDSNGGNPSAFTGLNPLIYTISAVILLGTLAIVAIITCWIRARRSFNNRMFRSNTTPQDYFDYINDNEFTPLTSSEFAASLQERPPTYVESERIEQNENGGNSNVETTVSPIPPPPQPHNLPSLTRLRVFQLENISSIADGAQSSTQLSTSEGNTNVNTSISQHVPISTNLIDLTDNQSDDDPLYT